MAVLIEGESVVILKAVLVNNYIDGLDNFLYSIPNETLTDDGELVRVGFMTNDEAVDFANVVAGNLTSIDPADIQNVMAIVEQGRGLEEGVNWLTCDKVALENPDEVVLACWLTESEIEQELATPEGWEFAESLSQTGQSFNEEDFKAKFTFVRSEEEVDVYTDNETGEEIFIGREE